MKPEALLDLLAEVEKEDPIDFSGLPFEADDLRRLACLNVSEMMEHWTGAPAAERELILAATVVRLVLENMVLNARIAILAQE
ncbi:MAG TPA: hypothetical protein PLH03_02065 [Methylophilaceae bacterium]|nr:hypothetical protein [Methylophilaceae bacterium]